MKILPFVLMAPLTIIVALSIYVWTIEAAMRDRRKLYSTIILAIATAMFIAGAWNL